MYVWFFDPMKYADKKNRGVSKGGAGGAIAPPPLFGRTEGALPLAVLLAPPPHFKKLLTPLKNIDWKV